MAASSTATTLTLALAGNPNSGKTTIFNALTGLRQKTGNYAGVTVEKRVGRCRMADGAFIDIIDLPGTYSLVARSPDERIAVDVLAGRVANTDRPDAVIVVIDASNLQRNLYLLSQFIETGLPIVVALNMMDVAERRGIKVSPDELSRKLGVPVIPVVGHKGKGIDELKKAFAFARPAREPEWPLPAIFRAEIDALTSHVESLATTNGLLPRALAERLIVGEESSVPLDRTVSSLVVEARDRLAQASVDPMQADVEAHYKWIEELSHSITQPVVDVRVRGKSRGTGVSPVTQHGRDAHATNRHTFTDQLDRILLHKVVGLATFAIIMGTVFVSIFWIATPLMDGVEAMVGVLGDFVTRRLSDGALKDLWTDGIVAGVGGVLVFVPQIAILFAFLAILEDSGYLARAAFLMDRLLAKVGLSGKAFVPLLSSFACAIPGVMATRTMESRRDRLATIFVAPFMSCSARLPVYGLLIGTFFATYSAVARGGILLSLYVLGIVAAVVTSFFFKRTLLKGSPASFILELPSYKFPQFTQVLRAMFVNTWQFIAKAGTVIFCLSVILWALTYWPGVGDARRSELTQLATDQFRIAQLGEDAEKGGIEMTRDLDPDFKINTVTDEEKHEVSDALQAHIDQMIARERLRTSFAASIGHGLEPIIRPLGYDWKMGVGLVGAFAAREVFVSTMGIVYAGNGDDEAGLAGAMLADRYPNGKPVWTPAVAISLLIWFVLAMQCMSTLAIVKRETGTWRWPIAQLLYMNGLAYVVCLVVYQIASRLGG
ncbi:MAG: ferrous iron transport protein B [Tepidisphaeraceae bacterium]